MDQQLKYRVKRPFPEGSQANSSTGETSGSSWMSSSTSVVKRSRPMIDSDEDDESGISNRNVRDIATAFGVTAFAVSDFRQVEENFNNSYAEGQEEALECLRKLHASILNRPGEDDMDVSPRGLRTELSLHQKHALLFMKWRETQEPAGGVLADDMGLGKTVSVIALLTEYKLRQEKIKIPRSFRYLGGTLIIAPVSVLDQWEVEIRSKTNGLIPLRVFKHHGKEKAKEEKVFAKYDVTLTSYDTVLHSRGIIHNVFWTRIVLDESHIIRNKQTQKSESCCHLQSKYKWLLTGTPIHNSEKDLFPVLKFLKLTPFDDYTMFNRYLAGNDHTRLNIIMQAIMVRRTKKELIRKEIISLPKKVFEEVTYKMDPKEEKVHEFLLAFSRVLFTEFLKQRKSRMPDQFVQVMDALGSSENAQSNDDEFEQIRQQVLMNYGGQIQSAHIFVLLLRLRQLVCHPSLIKAMLSLSDLSTMNLEIEEGVTDELPKSNILNDSNPIFNPNYLSSKVKILIDIINERFVNTRSRDKILIVSEWVSYLRIIGSHLEDIGVTYEIFHGGLTVEERTQVLDNFKKTDGGPKVLLLSLMAGGLGLNLTVANHLFLMTVHWNPQLERQAEDRIYRMGQTKEVTIVKFRAQDSIEDRIFLIQKQKLQISKEILSGSGAHTGSGLTLDDLKKIFGLA